MALVTLSGCSGTSLGARFASLLDVIPGLPAANLPAEPEETRPQYDDPDAVEADGAAVHASPEAGEAAVAAAAAMAEPEPAAVAEPVPALAAPELAPELAAEAAPEAPEAMAMSPPEVLVAEAMEDNTVTGRIRRVEAGLAQIQNEFDTLRPAIQRLVAIEADLNELIAQLFRLVAPPPPGQAMAPSPPAAAGSAAAAPIPLLPGGAPAPASAVAVVVPALPAPAADMDTAYSLHLASYGRMQNAVEGWEALRSAAPSVLSGLRPGTSSFTKRAEGEFIRLKAGPVATRAEANSLCADLRARGLYCDVLPYAGTVPF